jgi:hypothetical protein
MTGSQVDLVAKLDSRFLHKRPHQATAVGSGSFIWATLSQFDEVFGEPPPSAEVRGVNGSD